MLRIRSLVAALGVVVVLLPAAQSAAAVSGRIAGVSHHHPSGRDFSWLAARIKTSPGAQVKVSAELGSVLTNNPVKCRANSRGKAIAIWKIDVAGTYHINATLTKDGASVTRTDSYRVPFPYLPEWGPFSFKRDAGCHRGW